MDQPEGVGKGALARSKRPKGHGLKETEAGEAETGSGTAIFFLACIAALELEKVVLGKI
jgi:hypothetical protein